MEDIVLAMQKVTIGTNESMVPMSIVFGIVESTKPLQIRVDQKLVLESEQLILTRQVLDYELEMTVDHLTEKRSGGAGEAAFASHDHEYKGRKMFLVHNALELKDNVLMLRNQGGQTYVVIDKVVNA